MGEEKLKNPYKTLELSEGASKEEIRKAYKRLVKKYHPDKYANNPLSDLAEEKLEEINKAYNYLMKNKGYNQGQDNGYQSSSNRYSNNSYHTYAQIRELIKRGNIVQAEKILDSISQKDAEWFFLKGVISLQKGWYDQGYQQINRAVAMDPSNSEYRSTLNNLHQQNAAYRASGRNRGYGGADACDLCTCLCCSDCCCECLGGDLIACC